MTTAPRDRSLLHAYIGTVGLAGVAVLVALGRSWPGSAMAPAELWVLVACVVLGELLPIRAAVGREDVEMTTSTTFVFALLLGAGTAPAALALAAASVLADVRSRKAWWKVGFNVGQYALSTAAAGATLARLGGLPPVGSQALFHDVGDLLATAAAAAVFFVVNVTVTGTALAVSERRSPLALFREDFTFEVVSSAALLALGPAVLVVADRTTLLLPALLLPIAVAYRSSLLAVEKEHQAAHDALTGLANRARFSLRVREAVDAVRPDTPGGLVLLVDLDRFRDVNDTLGHHIGDELLRHAAGRLAEAVRQDDTVARLGGDEFAVVVPTASAEAADEVGRRLRAALAQPYEIDGLSLALESSVGVARFPEDGRSADVLLRRAEVAMYVAKATGRGLQRYDPAHDRRSPSRLAVLGELRRAMAADQLRLHYQPQVDVATGAVHGVEALVRWEHPTRGQVPPDEFVPMAEQTGLIIPLTGWVLERALAQARRWHDAGHDLEVAVNVSTRAFADPALPDLVARLLVDAGVAPDRLCLELTESALMADPEGSLQVMRRLRAIGVELSIDDYGTGHSALAYLSGLPVTELKIDRSFVTAMDRDAKRAVIVRSTVEMGTRLGLRVVAEGVESPRDLDRLRAMGCHLAQGYLVSRPLPADELDRWLDARPGLITGRR